MVLRAALTLAAAAALATAPSASAGGTLVAYVTDEASDLLVAVQPITGRTLWSTNVADGPHNIAATRKGRLVVLTSPPAGAVTIVRIEGSTFRVAAVLRGLASPHDVEIAPDDRYAYVTEERGARVAVVSLTRLRVVRRVAVGGGPHDLAVSPDGRRVWVTHGRSGSAMTLLDTTRPSRARVVRRIPVELAAPHDISWDAGRVWVTYWDSGLVGAFSPLGIRLFTRRAGMLTHHVLAANGRAWVTDHHGARAAVYDRAGRQVRTLRTCGDPHHVAVVAGVAVIACVDGRIVSFREESGRRIRMTRVGSHLHGVALVFQP
jgi:outer membrane protein assembly factor BamB